MKKRAGQWQQFKIHSVQNKFTVRFNGVNCWEKNRTHTHAVCKEKLIFESWLHLQRMREEKKAPSRECACLLLSFSSTLYLCSEQQTLKLRWKRLWKRKRRKIKWQRTIYLLSCFSHTIFICLCDENFLSTSFLL
jgi:hypothetical protein